MKNQFKKSLSLIMAVLMLMSCWVWVAPTEAEAGEKTQYYMKITTNVTDTGNEDGSTITINYKDTNGKGDTGTFTQSYGQQGWDGQVTVYSGPIDGWPTSFSWQFNLGGGRTENHRDITVYIGGTEETCTHQIAYSTGYNFVNDLTGTDYLNCTMSITGTAPYFNEVTSMEAGATSSTLGKLPNGSDVTSALKVTGGKDQYGVVWKAPLPTSGFSYNLKYTDSTGAEKALSSTYGTVSSSTNTATAYIKDDFQTLFPNTKSGKIQAYCSYGSSTTSATINVDFPTYKATFDSNGGLIGDDSSSAKTTVEVTNDKMNYGSVIGKAPAYASKEGFEFKGYYASKNADATGKTASFSGTKFEDNVTTVPSQGDTTWYAAWHAKPITATFMTADNQLIGTVEGRYNNYLTASNMYGSNLNATVKAAYTGNGIKFENNVPVYKDGSTTYTFAGWKIIKAYDEELIDKDEDTVLKGDVTFQATYTKADSATYTVKFKDAAGTVISEKGGYKYRDDVTNVPATEPTKVTDERYEYKFIGWAKDIGKNFYTVDETDKDENGATVVYTAKDGASFVVKGDASYVPVFRMVPREYKVTYNYTGDNNTPENTVIEGYHWADGVKMPEIKDNYTNDGFRYYLIGWKVGNDATVKQLDDIAINGDMTLTAVYGNAEAAKYTINFYGKAEDGVTDVLLNADSNIYEHNNQVTAPEVEQEIDTENSLYTFAGWSPAVNTTASGDADYYATYTKKDYADIHFYNYDGTLLSETIGEKENGQFVDAVIPAFSGATPVKAEDVVGTYNFTGWKDGDGNVVVPGTDKFTGDTYLYAQFETVYKEYTVKFENEGVTVSEKKYHYGEEITVPADPTKAADVEYIYDFRAWTPEVSEICYGDATYTATYRRTPQYYKVTWLNDAKKVHTESNYQYNAKIQQATIKDPVSYGSAGEGKTWAFKHWVQCDANGNDILVNGEQVLFVRGQRMGAEQLYFYPVFEAADNILTVKFYKEDGTSYLGEAKIPYGGNIADYAEPFAEKAPKEFDETYHYVINDWVNVNGGASVETVKADVSVKATYTAEAHTKDVYDITLYPTCTETGLADVSCSATECDKVFSNVVLDVIPDEGSPTGQLYVGSDKWTLDDFDSIDYADIKFVSPDTNVIVNAHDTGSRSKNNPEAALNRGVGKIDYYISETVVADPSAIGTWTNVYDYEAVANDVLNKVLTEKGKTMQDYIAMSTPNNKDKKAIDDEVRAILANYNANATGILSNLNLVNGKNYIIYIRISDREINGQSNMSYLSSGTISYGSKPAEITVTGEGFGTKFCAEADIRITDDGDGLVIYLDGEEVQAYTNPGTTSANGTFVATFKTAEAGSHNVTVIDKHGNKSTKIFEIKGSHTYRNYTIGASCVNPGSRYDLCTVCGAKANETEIPAFGHSYTDSFVDKAPDCINDGYRTYVCDNNCGTKLVLKPSDSAETLAQAKKWDSEAADGKGDYVALTADDLKNLKATGAHTYDMVKDANGEDTSEFVWIIDTEATCVTVGSKHRDCAVCGLASARIIEEIPVDTENGHKFNRAKVTLKPTCTETGLKTKACRNDGCNYVETVEVLEALGHVEGDYVVTKNPTCTEEGSQIRHCSVCDVEIGEAEVIPELGHAWNAEGKPFKGEDGKWYQKYVCGNDAAHEEDRIIEDYVEPVAATVTFKNGEVDYKVVPGFVGNTITAAQLGNNKPEKAADATYTYIFSHWADENDAEVKFPVEVKGDATYYAVYTEKFVNYTITYYEEDGATEFKKTGYLHNGEEVDLTDGPVKAEDWEYKYVFAGWQLTTDEDVVYTDKVTIEGANINLQATYNKVKKQYAVTYAYSKSDILETFAVEAGSTARDCEITPVKKFDSKYHYEFKAWNKAAQLAKVESNIYTTPDFDTVSHEYTVDIKTAATCTTNRVDIYTCSCGHTYTEEVANTALGHIFGEPVYDEETGKNVVKCSREGCGVEEYDTRTFTAKFFINADDERPIKTTVNIAWGTILDTSKIPVAPTKDTTATTEYVFKGWALKDDAVKKIVDFAKLEIKQDYEFVAVFDEITRKYNVVFGYDAKNIIKTYYDVPAGSDFDTDFTKEPVKNYDDDYHYEFSGWKGYKAGELNVTVKNVQSLLNIYAEFSKIEHTYGEPEIIEPTSCGVKPGYKHTCECGYSYTIPMGQPLDHTWVEVKRVEPFEGNDGYVEYKCSVCGEPKTETLEWVDNNITLEVKVLCNGAPQAGIAVNFVEKNSAAIPFPATTGKDGVAKVLTAASADGYACYVTIDGEKVLVTDFAEDGNGNYSGTYSYTIADSDCGCACHRDNFWGTIFRFFHKVIKFFTGEFKCCGNPDPMYG